MKANKTFYSFILSLFMVCSAMTISNAQCNDGICNNSNQNIVIPKDPKASAMTDANKDGNGSLGNSYSNTAPGLDFVTASKRLGRRSILGGSVQPAAFDIAGIPGGAVIEKAFLYCGTSGNGIAVTATVKNPANVTQNFPMALIGSGPDKCWGYSGSHSYRGDVTAAITGNGTYEISGLPTDPLTLRGNNNDTDGATLMVIYSVPGAPFDGTIHIADGSIVGFGNVPVQMLSYAPIANIPSNAKAFLGMGDVQLADEIFELNNTLVPNVQWDWWNYVETSTTLNIGQSSSDFFWNGQTNVASDCINWVFMGIYYQEESTCPDADGDTVCDADDNCPNDANPNQEDADWDNVGDVCDNCPNTANPNQENADGDAFGDVCDICPNDPNNVPTNTYFKDTDDDGYTDGTTFAACVAFPGYKLWEELTNPYVTDCDDNDPYAYPGQTWYQNADGDAYGSGSFTISCLRPPGYSAISELMGTNDCNDNNANTYPGAPEICDGQDNDCDGSVDEGAAPGGTHVGNVVFTSQAQLDAWASCITTIQGSLTIMGGNINNLGPLSNLTTVTGGVTIVNNPMLASLNGLQSLMSVGGNFFMYYNLLLSNCCAIDDLLTFNGVSGITQIFFNAFGSHCNSEAAIEAACPLAPLVANPGSFTTTGVSVEGKGITIFPNPATNETTVVFSELENSADLMVRDMLGRVVHQQPLEQGVDRITLDLNNGQFQNGLYLITLMNDGEMVTKHLMVRK